MKRPTVLHLCSDYCKQALYPRLCRALTQSGHAQYVYCAARTVAETERAQSQHCGTHTLWARPLLTPVDKVLFRRKILRVASDVARHIGSTRVNIVHAHFLYSDGAVALQLKQRLGLPFVVTVRNTDINAFMKYRPDLAGVMKRVVAQADRITFLSPAYVPRLLERLDFRVHQSVLRKIEIVPNGIDSHWLSTELIPPPPKNCWRIICVQDGRSNKNVRGLVAAASLLANSHPVILTIVGSHPRRSELARHARGLRIECVGVVHQWEELAHLYQRHHVYAMPSFHESFGLVYLEALSQGLPILHSRGEGPAGLFLDASICAQVDPWLPADISAGLAGLLSRDQLRRQECRDCVQKFTWPEVASRYADIYQQVASETGG